MKKRIRRVEQTTFELVSLDLPPTFGVPVEIPIDLERRYTEAQRAWIGVQRELEYILKTHHEERL